MPQTSYSAGLPRARTKAAFTLPEAIISATLLALLVSGVVASNLFGMRFFQIAETRLKTTDSARKALGMMADEIRESKYVWVGNITNGAFVSLLDGEPQTGTALLIQPSTNLANVLIYFLNTTDQTLRRSSSSTTATTLLADSVTNTTVFSAQDCFGNLLTNSQSDRVIHATLDLVHPQPWLPEGEYSKLETSVTRRTTD